MKTRNLALQGVFIGSLLLSWPLAAQPLEDLRVRLEALRGDQPLRVRVDVEVWRRGSTLLSAKRTKQTGWATVAADAKGVKVIDQRWKQSRNGWAIGRRLEYDLEDAPLDIEEAGELIDPAGVMAQIIAESTLVSDERVTWQEQPARLLVLRPFRRRGEEEAGKSPRPVSLGPLLLEARIWLNEEGDPLAMESSLELGLGPALRVTEHQTLTFQQVEGRLLAAEVHQTYAGSALLVLRQGDEKRLRVSVEEQGERDPSEDQDRSEARL